MKSLTREARDTLFLLAVLAWTLLPQLGRVPTWCAAFALIALAWRGLLAWRGARLPPAWMRVLLLIMLVALALQSFRSLLGKDAGVAMLVALAGLKTLELQARRDFAVVFGLGLFLVLANFLYSQSLATALGMVVAVTGLLTALVLAQMPAGRPPLLAALEVVAGHALVGAPLVALLFVLFPRVAPLWGVPGEVAGRTGLSDQLELGSVAELASDDAVALRVTFAAGQAPPSEQIYFRGPVLARIDASADPLRPRWLPSLGNGYVSQLPPESAPQLGVGGAPLDYEITFEPLRVTSVPLLELTAEAPRSGDVDAAGGASALPNPSVPTLRQLTDLQWVSARPLNERQRLRGRAWINHTIRERRSGSPNEALALPDGAFLRTREWAQGRVGQVQVSAPAGTTIDTSGAPATPPARSPGGLAADGYAVAVLAHIRNGGYDYTLAPGPVPPGVDALDDFWLDRKQGFCEHYAVALTVVLRSLGIPARIVSGYQGGHVNAIDGVLEVRQSDAHAWVEYWRDGEWVRVDPTAAVAPERVRRNLRLRPPPGLMVGALGRIDPGLIAQLAQLRQLWSAADHRWNQWVLDHGRQRQLELLRQLGWQDVDSYALARALLIGLASLGLAGAVWAAWDGRRHVARARRDAWLSGWQRLKQALTSVGIELPPHATPRSAAQAAIQRWGSGAEALARALDTLERLRYAAPGSLPPDGGRRQLAVSLRLASNEVKRLARSQGQTGA
jgi:hypothetical protein